MCKNKKTKKNFIIKTELTSLQTAVTAKKKKLADDDDEGRRRRHTNKIEESRRE